MAAVEPEYSFPYDWATLGAVQLFDHRLLLVDRCVRLLRRVIPAGTQVRLVTVSGEGRKGKSTLLSMLASGRQGTHFRAANNMFKACTFGIHVYWHAETSTLLLDSEGVASITSHDGVEQLMEKLKQQIPEKNARRQEATKRYNVRTLFISMLLSHQLIYLHQGPSPPNAHATGLLRELVGNIQSKMAIDASTRSWLQRAVRQCTLHLLLTNAPSDEELVAFWFDTHEQLREARAFDGRGILPKLKDQYQEDGDVFDTLPRIRFSTLVHPLQAGSGLLDAVDPDKHAYGINPQHELEAKRSSDEFWKQLAALRDEIMPKNANQGHAAHGSAFHDLLDDGPMAAEEGQEEEADAAAAGLRRTDISILLEKCRLLSSWMASGDDVGSVEAMARTARTVAFSDVETWMRESVRVQRVTHRVALPATLRELAHRVQAVDAHFQLVLSRLLRVQSEVARATLMADWWRELSFLLQPLVNELLSLLLNGLEATARRSRQLCQTLQLQSVTKEPHSFFLEAAMQAFDAQTTFDGVVQNAMPDALKPFGPQILQDIRTKRAELKQRLTI